MGLAQARPNNYLVICPAIVLLLSLPSRHSPRSLFSVKGITLPLMSILPRLIFLSFMTLTTLSFSGSFLKSLVLKGCDLFIPKSKSSLSNFPRWFNSETINLFHKVRSLRKRVHSGSATVNNVLSLKALELRLASKACSSKSDYESRMIGEFVSRKSNRIYKYIRSFT